MKKIRKSVFETNSSSMHSLILKKSEEIKDISALKLDNNGYLHIELNDYSYLEKDLKEVNEILSFVASYMIEYGYYNGWSEKNNYERDPNPEEMKKFKGIDILEKIVKKYTGAKGIIIGKITQGHFPAAESFNISEKKMFDPDIVEKLIFGKENFIEKWE
jgi:hypothetical protein